MDSRDWQFVPGSCETEIVNRAGHVFDAMTNEFVRVDSAAAARAFSDAHSALAGERNPSAKLSDEDADLIRQIYADGRVTQHELAQQFDVSQSVISRIVNRQAYRA